MRHGFTYTLLKQVHVETQLLRKETAMKQTKKKKLSLHDFWTMNKLFLSNFVRILPQSSFLTKCLDVIFKFQPFLSVLPFCTLRQHLPMT